MTFKDFYRREKHVALHAQSWRFRVVKYLVIVAIAAAIYVWKGLGTVGLLFLFLASVGVCVHFFFRYKTHAWTESWGPYKRIPLDGE